MFKCLEGDGGHMATVLFVLVMGVGLSVAHIAEGHDLVVAATASLYTLLKTSTSKGNDDNGNAAG